MEDKIGWLDGMAVTSGRRLLDLGLDVFVTHAHFQGHLGGGVSSASPNITSPSPHPPTSASGETLHGRAQLHRMQT